MKKYNHIAVIVSSICALAFCFLMDISLKSESPARPPTTAPSASQPPLTSTESFAASNYDDYDYEPFFWTEEDLLEYEALMQQGTNPNDYWDEGEAKKLKVDEAKPSSAKEQPINIKELATVPACSFSQNELDDLLTKLNELFNNHLIMAQVIQNAAVKLPNKDLATLLLNANIPQDVSRTCKVLLERIDYLQRLSIAMAQDIFYVVPASAEQSAREQSVI